MSKKLLFNFNREVIQNYTYVKYVGTIITATNTLEKPIKNAILKGSTKYRDIDTGEVLDAFEDGRNLELVSVKMPVLTTFNQENIFLNYFRDNNSEWGKDGNCTTTSIIQKQNGSSVKITGKGFGYTGFIINNGLPYGTYKFSCKVKVGVVGDKYKILAHWTPNVANNDSNGFTTDQITTTEEVTNFEYVGYFNNASNILFYAFYDGQKIEYNDIMITKLSDDNVVEDYKSNPQKYEYKTNILSASEDVVLCGIGEARDELDLMTGEVVQSVGEIVLDGSDDEEWRLSWGESENYIGFQLTANIPNVKGYSLNQVSNLLPHTEYTALSGKDYEWFVVSHINTFNLKIAKNKLISSNVDGLKRYLSINPLIAQYQLAEKTIKTVDLSILDQNENKVSSISSFNDTTHITASSETIPPIFEGYLATKEVE